MNAAEVLEGEWSRFRPVGLEELDASASLATRVDTKYLVPVVVLARLLEQLRPTHAVLAIEGRREFRYTSRYVDSPELGCYHDHRRGVRKRWKARTRLYEDSGQARWEVKLKDGRGMTVKHALPLGRDAAEGALTPQMRTFLAEVLRQGYGRAVPGGLTTTLAVGYRRSTLTHLGEENRVTVDSDLQMTAGGGRALLRPDRVLVETKSLSGRSAADQALRAAGVRPCSVSKYCAGLALLDPALPNHPWRRLLDRHFLSTTSLPSRTGKELAA
jgi:hypothetical protein